MSKPCILIARAVFPEVVEHLSLHFQVESNRKMSSGHRLNWRHAWWTRTVLTTGSERIDRSLLAACPRLRIVANMAVGYNNFDVEAMTAAGVQGTNTPDVLTETTADFGFALLMATARRVTESEHFLRAGRWKWSYDMFAGAEVHGTRWASLAWAASGRALRGVAPTALAWRWSITIARGSPLRWRPSARRATLPRKNCCAPPTMWCWCCPTRPIRTTPSARRSWRR
jgi:gluconate 2-dehydrogenase